MSATRFRDTSLERRRAAAAAVAHQLRTLRDILRRDDHEIRVVDGSAVAIELALTENDTRCFAVRVAVFVAPWARRGVERTLAREGFELTRPTRDGALLRMARRHGRRPVHVLFESVRRSSDEPHPSSPEAARARARRMAGAWLDPASTYRRVHHASDDHREVTESFEVQLIERVPSP